MELNIASYPEIQKETLRQWQVTIDFLAKLADVPSALLMRVHAHEIEVFRTSNSEGNPYELGEKANYNRECGLYCETVIRTGKALHVPNALIDKHWDTNPDIELNMISYFGLPILYPDRKPFGTICILDSKENQYSSLIMDSINQFRMIIEAHIALLINNQLLENNIRSRIQTEKELAESNSLKELLLDVITHDLKNPAGAIRAASEMALVESPENEFLQMINQSCDSLLNCIDHATTLSRVSMNEEIEKEKLDLVPIINSVANGFSSSLSRHDIEIKLNLPGQLLVDAHPIIEEIFKNYISNAIKYAHDGKKILIDSNETQGSVSIFVNDFGKTISEKDRSNVFLRSVQLEKGASAGRGLGLAIVKRIAEAHNAEVGVSPNKPTGNQFYLRIPVG